MRGGKRPGAGRPSKTGAGEPTALMPGEYRDRGQILFNKSLAAQLKKEGTTTAELALAIAEGNNALTTAILTRQRELVNGMMDIALGYKQVVIDGEGQQSVYAIPPDRQAIQWLLEKVHGKPTVKAETKTDTHISIHHDVPRPDPNDVAKLEYLALANKDRREAKIEEEEVYEVDFSEEPEQILEIE